VSVATPLLSFFVVGRPQTAGSKTAIPNPKTGRPIVMESGDRKAKKTWRGDIRDAAHTEIGDRDGWPLSDPLEVHFVFVRPRPASHFGTGRNAGVLKESAASHPVSRPDVLKLARAAEDALTWVLWLDDAQIVREHLAKRWAMLGEQEGMYVFVELAFTN
jgi:Holliday junction resolvase RusA-like endonuclease